MNWINSKITNPNCSFFSILAQLKLDVIEAKEHTLKPYPPPYKSQATAARIARLETRSPRLILLAEGNAASSSHPSPDLPLASVRLLSSLTMRFYPPLFPGGLPCCTHRQRQHGVSVFVCCSTVACYKGLEGKSISHRGYQVIGYEIREISSRFAQQEITRRWLAQPDVASSSAPRPSRQVCPSRAPFPCHFVARAIGVTFG
jgi:hypothetical protein